tara:strand:+ start:37 stop:1257 length:1221 start_codon:yes stop_codon:yes gene_type:complete
MNKAFFINGGSGRVLCSMPGLEKYAEKNKDFIIVAESWGELYLANKKLRDHVYFPMNKGLFDDKLKDKKIISPEPYRVNQYFNQKCNLIQAFDIEINELDDVRDTGELQLDLSKKEQIDGYNIVAEVRENLNKDKVVVFQPFGQSSKKEGAFIYDSTGRSFEISNVLQIIDELKKNYGVILMSEIEIPGWESQGIAHPQGLELNSWLGIINAADYFIGCDSVGQHMAHAVKKPATVVIGSTYPENISYPKNKKFTIIDNGKDRRRYSPIRLTVDVFTDRNNEDLMVLDGSKVKQIVKSVKDKIGVSKIVNETVGLKGFKPPESVSGPKSLKPSPSKEFKSIDICSDNKNGAYPKKPLEKNTIKYNGFKKPDAIKPSGFKKPDDNKSFSRKKPIDQLLEIEAKAVKS